MVQRQGRLSQAEEVLMKFVNTPKSYGEAKAFFNQEAYIFYCLGKIYAALGN